MNLKSHFIESYAQLAQDTRHADNWWQVIENLYEPRAYHNLHHITAGLAEIKRAPPAQEPLLLLYSWLLHDAVQGVEAERRSAWFASQLLGYQHHGVEELIMTTKTHTASTPDAALISDIDLSILGSEPERYALYEAQIRQEYSWVDDDAFRQGRRTVLRNFQQRNRIYQTNHFFSRYEQRARHNLAWALHYLEEDENFK